MLMLARHRAGKCALGGEAASGNAARGGRRGGARGEAARGEKRREGDAAGRGPCLLTLGAPLVLDELSQLGGDVNRVNQLERLALALRHFLLVVGQLDKAAGEQFQVFLRGHVERLKRSGRRVSGTAKRAARAKQLKRR